MVGDLSAGGYLAVYLPNLGLSPMWLRGGGIAGLAVLT